MQQWFCMNAPLTRSTLYYQTERKQIGITEALHMRES